jgi:hypothetical protein
MIVQMLQEIAMMSYDIPCRAVSPARRQDGETARLRVQVRRDGKTSYPGPARWQDFVSRSGGKISCPGPARQREQQEWQDGKTMLPCSRGQEHSEQVICGVELRPRSRMLETRSLSYADGPI